MAKRFQINEACTIEDNILIIHKSNISIRDVLNYAETKGVEGLDFRNRILLVQDVEEICEGLRTNTNIIYLTLSSCCITDLGINKLCIALKQDIGLTELCLNGNQITSSGAAALGYSLISNTHLYLLDLESNKIKDDGILSLLSSVRKNDTLGAVHLNDNLLTKFGKALIRQIDNITKTSAASEWSDLEDSGSSSQEDEVTYPQLDLGGEDYDY